MWPNPQFPGNLVTFTEEILNGKLHFLCSGRSLKSVRFHKDYSPESFRKFIDFYYVI